MGLLNKLTQDGSAYTLYNGATPPINPLATKQSKLHADDTEKGYSTIGNNFNIVSPQYNEYDDGVVNPLPPPSILDLPKLIGLTYENNQPG